MSAGGRNNVRRSGLTNPYQDLCSLSETGWWIWFGLARAYQSLPIRTCKQHGGFGLVTPPFTIAYQPADLGALLPCETFTNLYHRDGGLGIDLSVGVMFAGVAVW